MSSVSWVGKCEPCFDGVGNLNQWNTCTLILNMEFIGTKFAFESEWPRRQISHRRMMLIGEKPISSTKRLHVTLLKSATFVDHTKNRSTKNYSWVGYLNTIWSRGVGNLKEQIFKCWNALRGGGGGCLAGRGCWSFDRCIHISLLCTSAVSPPLRYDYLATSGMSSIEINFCCMCKILVPMK